MDKSLVKGLVIGGLAATAVGAVAGYKVIGDRDAYAEVVSVEPATRTISTPRYVWRGEPGTVRMDHDPGRRIPVKDGELVTERGGADSGSG